MSGNLDPYYSRHDDHDGMGAIAALALIVIGMVIGMVAITLARKLDHPAPVVVGVNEMRCSFCHYERVVLLDSNKKYKAHHQKKRSMTFNEAAESEYLARLIAGGPL